MCLSFFCALKLSHDCGLFTFKAIEHWNGHNLPNIMEFDEIKLRKRVLLEWIQSPANKLENKTELFSKGKEKGKMANQ